MPTPLLKAEPLSWLARAIFPTAATYSRRYRFAQLQANLEMSQAHKHNARTQHVTLLKLSYPHRQLIVGFCRVSDTRHRAVDHL